MISNISKVILFLIIMMLFSTSCYKDESYKMVKWENRPLGIPCTPTRSNATLENNELTFNKEHILCVSIKMKPASFTQMRNESRFGPSIQDQEGLTAKAAALEYFNQCDVPFPSYYNWYHADLKIDGIFYENVGVRKKGFLGSIYSTAPSIKINTSKYEDVPAIGLTNNITLNNNSEDPSRVIQGLYYKFFEWANYPAPRCNLANVSVNGEPLGVFSHVEAIDDAFLRRNFGNSSGDLYECQLTDFRTSWLSRWESKGKATNNSKYKIAKIAQILSKTPTTELLSKLEKYINIKRFIRFWALEIIINHTDGYTRNSNNMYLYFDPNDNDRATFIPTGINYFNEGDNYTIRLKEFTTAELPRRLSRCPEAAKMLEDEIHYLLNSVWDEAALIGLIDHFEAQIKTAQIDLNDHSTLYYYLPNLRAWIQSRKESLEETLRFKGIPRGNSEPSKICHFED